MRPAEAGGWRGAADSPLEAQWQWQGIVKAPRDRKAESSALAAILGEASVAALTEEETASRPEGER